MCERGTHNRHYVWLIRRTYVPSCVAVYSHAEAVDWLALQGGEKVQGRWVDPSAGKRRFGDYAADWNAYRQKLVDNGDLAPSTWKRDDSYLRNLVLPHFEPLRVDTIHPSMLTDWLVELTVKPATKAHALQIVRSVLERARRDKAIPANPADDVQDRPKPASGRRTGRALTDYELSRVIGAAYDTNESTAFVTVAMAQLGLRIGEALGLRRGDFDLHSDTVTIRRTRNRDGNPRPLKRRSEGESRTLPLTDPTRTALERHMATMEAVPMNGDLFVMFKGDDVKPRTYPNWRRRHWVPTVDRADVGPLVPHDLRHTAITRLFEVDRWSVAEVMAYVGHKDSRVTLEIYSHLNTANLPRPSTAEAVQRALEMRRNTAN
jgi:integrase